MRTKFTMLVICFSSLILSNYRTQETSILCETNTSSAITWIPGGGRFGDDLLSYAKAKWLSRAHKIPLLYLPFTYSDQLMLHEQEKTYSSESEHIFTAITHLPQFSPNYRLRCNKKTLYICHWKTKVTIDWFNKDFVEELKKTIAPREPLEKVMIPDNVISIAAHVRNGGGFTTDTKQEKERCPLRFVPDEFFIQQIARLADMFPHDNLYVHIFTDHAKPAELMQKFKNTLNNPRITFGCRENDNSHNANVLEDFFSMMEFDCLIRPGSHYSRFVQRLGKNKVVIYPQSITRNVNGESVINVINIKTRATEHDTWKTKKITIT